MAPKPIAPAFGTLAATGTNADRNVRQVPGQPALARRYPVGLSGAESRCAAGITLMPCSSAMRATDTCGLVSTNSRFAYSS